MGLAKNLLPVANRLLALNLVFPKPTCSSSSFGVGIACLRKPAAPQKFINPLAALSPPPRVNGIIGVGIVRLFGVKVLGVKMGVFFGVVIGVISGVVIGVVIGVIIGVMSGVVPGVISGIMTGVISGIGRTEGGLGFTGLGTGVVSGIGLVPVSGIGRTEGGLGFTGLGTGIIFTGVKPPFCLSLCVVDGSVIVLGAGSGEVFG